jgi:hypothetical protein
MVPAQVALQDLSDAGSKVAATLPPSPDEDSCAPQVPGWGLIAGALPIDLCALEQAADQFFARLECLSEDLADSATAVYLARWLVPAILAAGAAAMARRQIKPPEPGSRGAAHHGWAECRSVPLLLPEDSL